MMLSFLQITVWWPGRNSKVEVQNPVQLEVHQGRFSWEGLWIPLGNLLWVHWGSTGALWVYLGYTVGTLGLNWWRCTGVHCGCTVAVRLIHLSGAGFWLKHLYVCVSLFCKCKCHCVNVNEMQCGRGDPFDVGQHCLYKCGKNVSI